MITSCLICKKEFKHKPSKKRVNCSKECAKIYFTGAIRRSYVEKECATCNKSFLFYPYDQPKAKFCSKACRAKFHSIDFQFPDLESQLEKISIKFNKFIDKQDCWIWTGYRNNNNYGLISFKRTHWLVHRISWMIHNRQQIPDNMNILHKCDNPPCANPNHLFLGTQKDNVDDMLFKGRHKVITGLIPKNRKLTKEQVLEIRRLLIENKLPGNQIADKFNIDKKAIYLIKQNKAYKDIL